MKASTVASALAAGASATLLGAVTSVSGTAAHAQQDPFGESWPAGEGRELTGAWCGGCHSLNLVRQQGLTRPGWDELLHWMTEKQNMPPLEGERRDVVLDYLAANFGTDRASSASETDAAPALPPLVPPQGIERTPLGIRGEEG